jgi:hypothetical protein
MIDRITGGRALPSEVLDQIVAKTDGVPLFVEELTKTVLESGLVREENGSYVLASVLTPLAIPATLQDSLMARLDRLAPVKEVAQIGAAIGREFSYRLLEAVSPIKGPALQDALHQLTASELIYVRGAPPEATYVFKHALVQDTAYASMLRSRRQRIHADIARVLAERFAGEVESQPAIIAHHYTEAGLAEPAVRAWLAAAELALTRSALVEAERHVAAGLALIPGIADQAKRQTLELALHLAGANALRVLKGYNMPETVAALTAAKRLLDFGMGTDSQRLSVLHGLCSAHHFGAEWNLALVLSGQMVEFADQQDDVTYRLIAYRMLGTSKLFAGRIREALEAYSWAERQREIVQQKPPKYRFGGDPILGIVPLKILSLLLLGLFDQATQLRENMRGELRRQGHANTVAICTFFDAFGDSLVNNSEACERHSAQVIAYCAEKKAEQWRLLAAVCNACARAMSKPAPEHIAAIPPAIDAYHRSGGRVTDSHFIAKLAEARLKAGHVTGAEAALREAFAFVEESGERFWLADLHRVAGRIELQRPKPNPAQAETRFLQAIEIARQQEARLLELRAATDLARLWREQGKRHEARDLLAPIYSWFTEGFDTLELREAKAGLGSEIAGRLVERLPEPRLHRVPASPVSPRPPFPRLTSR